MCVELNVGHAILVVHAKWIEHRVVVSPHLKRMYTEMEYGAKFAYSRILFELVDINGIRVLIEHGPISFGDNVLSLRSDPWNYSFEQ